MWDYTDKVMELFYNPRNQGKFTESQEGEKIITGEVGSIACGDALRLHLKIDETTETITDAKFQTFGCASAIASSEALTQLLKGKTVAQALKLTNREIADYLGGLPEEKMHCSVMGQEALEAAINSYRGIATEDHHDDEGTLICRCFGITDSRIRRVIIENNLTKAEQVTNYIKAGGGCSSCLTDIDDILAAVWEAKPVTQPLTNLQKIKLIEQILETEIRPVLAEDGGDVELFDLEGDTVKVKLKGACGGCSSSHITIKTAIEARLQQQVLPSLVVEAV